MKLTIKELNQLLESIDCSEKEYFITYMKQNGWISEEKWNEIYPMFKILRFKINDEINRLENE